MTDDDALQRWERLGRRGYTVSIVCGPSGTNPFRWSVDVLAPSGETFARPYAANNLAHAVTIAEREITARGWEW
jgi:hypothetical protein